tara:strand:- start:15621 stop:16250 length:630 start_codon:yes stop_codon:yes gene_type:complete
MAKPHLKLDLRMIQHFPAAGVWTRIDPDVRKSIACLGEVDERVEGVERLSFLIKAEYKIAEDVRRSQIFLRASLSEFVSMEDAAILDFHRLGYGKAPKIAALADPRLHVVRLLRHANVHLSATQLMTDHKSSVWIGPDGPQEFQYLSFHAVDVDRSIRTTNQSKRYSPEDLTAMIDWLLTEQAEWGIQNVVLRAAETFARELARLIPSS